MTRFLALLVLLSGCAGQQLTPEEREYKEQLDFENWRLCDQVLSRAGVVTLHVGHTHSRHGILRNHHIRQDLATNNCRRILGDYWAEY